MHENRSGVPGTASATRKDARNRGWRTLLQGAVSTVLVAVAAVVADQVTPGAAVDWTALGAAAGTAALTAVAAWVQRRLEARRRPDTAA